MVRAAPPLAALLGLASAYRSPQELAATRERILEAKAASWATDKLHARSADAHPTRSYFPAPNPPLINLNLTSEAAKFYVDGATIPEVDWDAGPSYAGLLPISNSSGETRKLFFWFWPSLIQAGVDDLVFWTNGGPGCSSMMSMLQETGPISWRPGTARPVQNPYSWTNATSILYVEQPVGTGFSQGTPTARDEEDLAAQLFGFFQQWLRVFPAMAGKKFWLTGESYAGQYVPYIADYIYAHQHELNLPLQGLMVYDPSLSHDLIQEVVAAVPLMNRYNGHTIGLTDDQIAQFNAIHEGCGYADYVKKYSMAPPPPAPFPLPGGNATCQGLWDQLWRAALAKNEDFNIYHIIDTPPLLWNVLGFPQETALYPGQTTSPIYFNRTDVKAALHAPQDLDWNVCANKPVFPDGDASPPSALSVLPGVIEKSAKVVIGHGLMDMVLIAEGTRIVIQNMTWNGAQGFQKPITKPFKVKGQGALGYHHTERNLTYVEIELCGHMVPQYQPVAAWQHITYLLGQRDSISA